MKTYKDFLAERCWPGHKPVPGKKPYSPGSCVKEEIEQVQEIAPVIAGVARAVGPAITRTAASAVGNVAKKVVAGGARVVGSAIASTAASSLAKKDDSEDGDDGKFSSGPAKPATKNPKLVSPNVNEDWQKVNKADKTDGLSQKAVNAYRRENPGSKLKTAVTEKNPTGKRASRRKSFCSRMGGMKKRLTNPENARDPDSPINKALRRWNC
jgi:hypothetical protein